MVVGMPTLHLVPAALRKKYEVHEWRNAAGVISTACATEWKEVQEVLLGFRLRRSHVVAKGGNKSPVAREIDSGFYGRGWIEKSFDTKLVIDGQPLESPTHSVDCFKGRVALEVEWNNKDPFFDRDLNNFRLLFDLRAIDVGIIVTRCDELQQIFNALGKGSSYGQATTHMSKLMPRIEGGGGGGCPVLVFGIRKSLYVED